MKIEIEADMYENRDELRDFFFSQDYSTAIHQTRERIRVRRKHHTISDDEDKFLSELLEILYFE